MKNYADLVNPYIGTISHMLTSTVPEVMYPYGMARSTPVVDSCSDYYCNDTVLGYPVGEICVTPGIEDNFDVVIDHSRENFKCYYMYSEAENSDITIESTVTEHVYVYRFANAPLLRITHNNSSTEIKDDRIYIKKAGAPKKQHGRKADYSQYIIIVMDKAFKVVSQNSDSTVLAIEDGVTVKGSVSYISFDKANESLEKEALGQSFENLSDRARDVWNKQLSKIEVEGNTEEKQIIFYTALYRSFQRCTDYTEYGEYYSAYDNSVHNGVFYTGDGLWDTFRSMHPLQLIVDQKRHEDILNSYVAMYKQSGLMPSFPGFTGDLPVMIGFHAASLFADALAKGIKTDFETAYEGLYKNATQQSMMPWCADHAPTAPDECYYNNGFFPALAKGETETSPAAHPFERRQAIAVTLEHSYDDFCLAQLAKHLGKEEDYKLFMKRSENYKNLYNKEIGYMAPKDINGEWVEDFDPIFAGGMGGREYTAENNTLTYSWSVFHDIDSLAELMGGKEATVQKLDSLFTTGIKQPKSKYVYLGQFPDSTGLMGQFAMGNEPSFHIPYIYNYLGYPWKTQKKLRELMDIWFTNSPTGICGDEDGGAMSSWYVFSAMGLYPVCPGKDEYAISSPIFDRVKINMENGKSFIIESAGAPENKYIQSATINSNTTDTLFISHSDITDGATLTLKMGRKPKF